MRLTSQHYRNHFINSPSSQPQSNPLYPLGQQIQFDMHQWDDVRYRACSECVQWSRPERHLFVGICVCVYVCDWHSVSLRSRLDREPLDSLQACLLIWSACSDHSRGKAPSLSPSFPHPLIALSHGGLVAFQGWQWEDLTEQHPQWLQPPQVLKNPSRAPGAFA